MRRREWLAGAAAGFLTACGGGGAGAGSPTTAAMPSTGTPSSNTSTVTPNSKTAPSYAPIAPNIALQLADYILALQTAEGAIRDDQAGSMINEDSNMEYALIGLAAAYSYSGNTKYLDGLRKGVEWLAQHMTMDDPRWNGSYPLSFAYPSYAGDYSTRGVDATSSLFVYCVYLHQRLSGSTTLRDTYQAQIVAALTFLDTYNTAPDGFSLSSWVNGTLYAYEYAADQVDVYLGWQAASVMFPAEQHYADRAAFYRSNIEQTFFLAGEQRYSIGRDQGSALETIYDGFDGIFPNGYLPWALGPSTTNTAALAWLESWTQPDGSMKIADQTLAYSLSVGMYLCGCAATGRAPQQAPIDWLCTKMFDPQTGAIDDSTADNTKYTNVAGFCAVGLLGFAAFASA